MPNKKNPNSSQFSKSFYPKPKVNQETINLQKNIEKNRAKHEDKFQKWVAAVHADGSLKTIDSITKAMLQMSADELHNVYRINPSNAKNTKIDGLSEYFKTNHSGIAPNKISIMILVLSCVLATANCNPIPDIKAQTKSTNRGIDGINSNLLQSIKPVSQGRSQVYNDYNSISNFRGQNLYNSTLNGQQNNLNIVCGNKTNNNTANFTGATSKFFEQNLGETSLPIISPNYLYASEKNSLIEADEKLFSDLMDDKIEEENSSLDILNEADDNYLNSLFKLMTPFKQINFDENGNIPIKIGNATFKDNTIENDNLVKNSKDNLSKTLKTLQNITNGGIVLNQDQDLNTIKIDFINDPKPIPYKGKNAIYYGDMNVGDGTITYNTNNNITHANNFEMHEVLHWLGFAHNFNPIKNVIKDCTITSEPWGKDYDCNSIMSYCHEDFNTINGPTILYILDPKNNIIQKIPEQQAKKLKEIYSKYEDALHKGLTFFDIMDIQNKYAKPPHNQKLINFVKENDLTKYLLFKTIEDGVLQYEGTGDKINIINCLKYYKKDYTYPIDPKYFTEDIEYLKNGSKEDNARYEQIDRIKRLAKNQYIECIFDTYKTQEENGPPFDPFNPSNCNNLNSYILPNIKGDSYSVNKNLASDDLVLSNEKISHKQEPRFKMNPLPLWARIPIATLTLAMLGLCLACRQRACCCKKKQLSERRASFSGRAAENLLQRKNSSDLTITSL